MSDILSTDAPTGLTLSQYTGPELPDGTNRRRYQLTWPDGRQVDMSIQDWCGIVSLASRWLDGDPR